MEQQFEGLSEEQKSSLLKKRQEMLKNMGVKNAGKMMNESIVSTNGANSSMAAKLAAIRSGAAKSELNKYISATGKGAASGVAGFEGIPEPSKRKNPNQVKEEINPEYRQELASFSSESSDSHELSRIDAMFGGDGPVRMSGGGNIAQNSMNQELSLDSMMMPSFNPEAALQQKARAKVQNQNQTQNNPYLKFASDTPPVANDQFVDVGNNVSNQSSFNVNQMQMMMETIAKGIAEKTIRNVLNEYSEQQKGKVFFEYYNKEKGIIKTADGKYYRLTQVELKKR